MTPWFHGGVAGLSPGDVVIPAPAHVQDGCPICEGKREGRAVTVGEYRRWLRQFGARAQPLLLKLREAPDWEVLDPPRAQSDGVYLTTSREYATWYAARSQGDLYQVKPDGPVTLSPEDHFETVVAARATVVAVIRRDVRLTRAERRHIEHVWKKADARMDRRRHISGRANVQSTPIPDAGSPSPRGVD